MHLGLPEKININFPKCSQELASFSEMTIILHWPMLHPLKNNPVIGGPFFGLTFTAEIHLNLQSDSSNILLIENVKIKG